MLPLVMIILVLKKFWRSFWGNGRKLLFDGHWLLIKVTDLSFSLPKLSFNYAVEASNPSAITSRNSLFTEDFFIS